MSTGTRIEWTDASWNPVVGCTPVSPGCLNCYAATFAARGLHQSYVGLTVRRKREGGRGTRAVFNGTVRCLPERLTEPLHWRKPRRVFVNSMSDLFHEAVPFEFIDKVFAVMALCPQHTFQVLTKRPERMAEYTTDRLRPGPKWHFVSAVIDQLQAMGVGKDDLPGDFIEPAWPLPNVWLGTSTEDQKAADERIPHLLRCPAAVRFLSCEPLLGPVHLGTAKALPIFRYADQPIRSYCGATGRLIGVHPELAGRWQRHDGNMQPWVDWVIAGGESGANARPCDVAWIRSIVAQCKAAGVPVFVKQLGSKPYDLPANINAWPVGDAGRGIAEVTLGGRRYICPAMEDPKGGDWSEWPEDLRVREFPEDRK